MKHFALVLMVAAAFAAEGYHTLNKIKIGGTGGWDYVTADGANHRLYVSHGTSIAIVDTDTTAVVGTVSELHGVHGIAIAADINKGFISNGQSNSVTVFDLSTFAKTAEIQTGQNPDAICYEPKTQRVFTFNGRSGDSTAIDAKSNAVLATIPLGGKPEFCVASGDGKLYDNIEDKSRTGGDRCRQTGSHPHRQARSRATGLPAWRSIPRTACCFPSAATR